MPASIDAALLSLSHFPESFTDDPGFKASLKKLASIDAGLSELNEFLAYLTYDACFNSNFVELASIQCQLSDSGINLHLPARFHSHQPESA